MGELAGRFVGQSVLRREDPRLLTGRGRFVADVLAPGILHAAFARSDVARARITRLDVAAARALPGVRAVLTNADLAPHLAGPMLPAMIVEVPRRLPPQRPLAEGDVRFVGEPFALVVADSREVAEDAVDLIEVDYELLPAVVGLDRALDGVELVHAELDSNIAGRVEADDPELEAIFAGAAHVVTETFWQQRQSQSPMETRGVLASWDPYDGRLEVRISSQNPHEVRRVLSRALGVAVTDVRVVQDDVGGGFGQKFLLPREEIDVVLASRLLGRPVRWIEDRRENLVAASHARSDRMTCSMALDADGRILGVRLDHVDDCGALPVGGGGGSGTATVTRFTGPYRMPHVAYRTTSVWTNTCARGAYRGPWMMETTAREQMMDTVARELGIDPVELRRRNALRPDDLPYPSPTGPVVDGVSVVETLEAATAAIDYEGFRAEQARARDEGRHLGIGVSLFVEPQGSVARLRVETATARLASDGSVTVHVGSGAHGQGIATTMAQVVADELGVAVDAVRVLQGDTDSAPFGNGTGGSRTGPFLSAAVRGASVGLRERILRVASDVLEASADDLSLVDGGVAVRGTPSRSLTLAEIAFEAMSRPSAVGGPVDAALEATFRYEAPGVTWSNACHVATCEVDGETGEVRLLRYVVAEDCGQLINPKIVDGQVAGGVTQGIGGALLEHVVYDDDGNPLSTSYLDYLVPVASGLPRIEIVHVSTSDTPKGMGEGGAIGAPACVTNAVADALAPLGAPRPRPPLSPSTVLAAIHGW